MSLQPAELHNPLQGAVIVDTTTDVPLAIQLFEDEDQAAHFLLWAEHEGREPFGGGTHYNYAEMAQAQIDWHRQYVHEDVGGGGLTAVAQAQLDAESMELDES